MKKIVRNAIRCKACGDVIESKTEHDFHTCSCGRVSVDGGHNYLRRTFTESMDDFEECSQVVEES